MLTETEPLAVWDVSDPSWWPKCDARAAWLREHGFPDEHMWRVEFHLMDAPFARVFAYHLNEDGKRHWTHGHDPETCKPDHTCGACKLPPYDLLLSELPPRDLLYL